MNASGLGSKWLVGSALSSVLLLLAVPSPAGAVCASLPYDGTTLMEEPGMVVFAGKVADTQASQQNALLRVEEIWYGDPLPEWQAVYGVTQPDVILSATTRFEVGGRYLVVATRGGSILLNDGCRTAQLTDSLSARAPQDAMRPTPVRRPASWGHPGPVSLWMVIGVGAAAMVLVGGWGSLVLRRRQD